MTITFCGHSKINIEMEEIEKIKAFIVEKIKTYHSITFYLGGYGYFDNLILKLLKDLKNVFPLIKIIFVSPYINSNYSKLKYAINNYDESIYPPLENIPRKFAILKRNEWMIDNSDFVIAYVKYSFGGASKTLNYAIKKKVQYINFAK